MRLVSLLLLSLLLTWPPRGPARADVAFSFAFTTAFAAVDPFPNPLLSHVYAGATGFVAISNTGPGVYAGIVRVVAISAYDGDLTFTVPGVTIPAGGTVSVGMPIDSSAAGGFNSFTGSFAPSADGTFRPGIIIFMQGTAALDGESGAIKIAAQDLDMRTGTIVTDPSGFETDSFVLQGGDPFGLYNGDVWELGLRQGHLTIAGTAEAVLEPPPSALLPIAAAALVLARARARRISG